MKIISGIGWGERFFWLQVEHLEKEIQNCVGNFDPFPPSNNK